MRFWVTVVIILLIVLAAGLAWSFSTKQHNSRIEPSYDGFMRRHVEDFMKIPDENQNEKGHTK